MDRNYDIINFISNFILRMSRLANFADIVKIAIIFIKTTFIKTQKNLKNRNYVCIKIQSISLCSSYNKSY